MHAKGPTGLDLATSTRSIYCQQRLVRHAQLFPMLLLLSSYLWSFGIVVLAHLGPANLEKTSTMVEGMKLDDKTSLEGVCQPCIAGRMTREPRRAIKGKSDLKPLDRAYADLVGPMETKSLNGNSYLLVLIVEASKLSLVKPVAKKSEVKLELPILISELERLGNGKLARLQTDCGGEFTS